MPCKFCGAEVNPERFELGYHYCMDRACQKKALSGFADNWRLILVPKQGFQWVPAHSEDLKMNNKSSGR